MNLGELNKVWEIKALKKKPREDEARKILEKVANQVQPIMTRRKWRVKLLSEFCPTNPRLLGVNVNRGVHVKLRLRRVNHDADFLSYHQVLDTMLHELCHNAHGPHNASFYKLWDELRKECEELMSKGITGTGQGFDVPGKRLGGFSRQPPLSSLRTTAAKAAEKRVRAGNLLPSGPQRLGGDSSIMSDLTPVQAAAMAAERRLFDDIWCGSQSAEALEDQENDSHACTEPFTSLNARPAKRSSSCSNATNSFPPSSSHQWGSDVIDLTEEASETRCSKRSCIPGDQGPSSSSKDEPISGVMKSSETSPSTSYNENQGREEPAMWQCAECTLLNPLLAPICELCTAAKPKEREMKHKVWSCKFCTLENEVKLEKCEACGQWRYSCGQPLSTRAPNVSSSSSISAGAEKECEELMSKGITGTGQGFDVPGKRLGGFSRQPPLSSLRATAAKAAEKRVRTGNLLPSGPQRLGGDSSIMSHLTPIQAAAMAAERRLLDDIWCGSQSAEAFEEKENDSHTCTEPLSVRSAKRSSSRSTATSSSCPPSSWGSDVIDLTEEEASESSRCTKRSCNPAGDQGPSSSETSSSTGYNANQGREDTAMWECEECTLLNPLLAPICELCTAAKPNEREMKHKVWSCKFCTLENEVMLEKCEACGQWRYSYGQPLSTRAPNVGT